MLGSFKKNAEKLQGLERVKEWTRERFRLSEQDVILVSEIMCSLPGCPPLETVVAFWTPDQKRHHFKVFKPPEEVTQEDLPFDWLMESLVVPEGYFCECC